MHFPLPFESTPDDGNIIVIFVFFKPPYLGNVAISAIIAEIATSLREVWFAKSLGWGMIASIL